MGLEHWESDCNGEAEGAFNKQHLNLGKSEFLPAVPN